MRQPVISRYGDGWVCELVVVVVVVPGPPGCRFPLGETVVPAGADVVCSVVVETVCGGGDDPQAASTVSPPNTAARKA